MLEILNNNDFDELYHLIEKSFPDDEYRSYDEQKELFNNPLYSVYTLYSESHSITAFIAVWEFDKLAFIEHFAVDSEYRSCGLGSSILNELIQRINKMICLEVEPPKSEMSCRRIKFYERNNFFLNEYHYIQPPMSKGKNPIPLLIMTYKNKVDEQAFKQIKSTLYSEVYKCK